MSLGTLRERKRDLEQIKEYQCGDHPTRILYVNNLTLKDYQALETLLEAQPQTIKAIFIDELPYPDHYSRAFAFSVAPLPPSLMGIPYGPLSVCTEEIEAYHVSHG